MAGLKYLLDTIEDVATRGEHIAVVRVLNVGSLKTATVTVSDGKMSPPIPDQKLVDQILAAVQNLAARGGVAALIDAVGVQGSPVTLAIEIIKPKLELLIFGAGHVGQAVATIGALMGYDVTVVDEREEFASRTRIPDERISLLVSDYASAAGKLTISSGTAVVIVTRGHQHDETCLKSVVRSTAGYIGMIGSRKRVLSVFKKLAADGIAEQELQRIHAPIGLRIGARTPQEIAVSILAEIIDHVNQPERGHKGETDGI